VACAARLNDGTLIQHILCNTEFSTKKLMHSACDALAAVYPESWSRNLPDFFLQSDKLFLLSKLFRNRRQSFIRDDYNPGKMDLNMFVPEVIRTIGRLGNKSAIEYIWSFFDGADENPTTRLEAALALMRLGNSTVLTHCMKNWRMNLWMSIPIVLMQPNNQNVLQMYRPTDIKHSDYLTALGLSGQPSDISLLIDYLRDDKDASYAAESLYIITGVELYETVFVSEELEVDELFDDEREGMIQEQGSKSPLLGNKANAVRRLSRNPDDWGRWWSQNKMHYTVEQRYRFGIPITKTNLIKNLQINSFSSVARRMTLEELKLRFGLELPLEIDMTVSEQIAVLGNYSGRQLN